MAMKQGVTQVANSALDIKDQLCSDMIDAGVDPKQALIASTVATKARMDDIINGVLGHNNAAQFTHNLAQIGRNATTLN